VPSDADWILDVAISAHPHSYRGCDFQGQSPKVRDGDIPRSFTQTGEFLRRIEGLLTY